MEIDSNTHLCLSIVATGRCNCSCSYCHFYASHDRNIYNRDIDWALFERYVEYIKYLTNITPHISCRLSGGEPLCMGDKMYLMTDYIAEKTGINPYIMTNGKLLTKEVVEQAKQHHVASFVISVENPFAVSTGAVDAMDTISKFTVLQNTDVPLYFGMLVLENSQYKNINKIADLFYETAGTLPPMCEVNYLPYKSPTDKELEDLHDNVCMILKKYNGRVPISLFPYIIPEYYSGNRNGTEYLTEFPIDDKHGMLCKKNEEVFHLTEKQINRSYIPYVCDDITCDWFDSCKHLKWVWNMDTDQIPSCQKMKDYCRYKKKLSEAFFEALVLGE